MSCFRCDRPLPEKAIKFCSSNCCKRHHHEQAANRTTNLPQSGKAMILDGEYYREGAHGFIYRWGVDEWLKSTKTKKDMKKAKPGRFINASFVIENTQSSKTARA